LARVVGRDADDLVVTAGLVGHPEHPDRPGRDEAARPGRLVEEHERVERVAVLAEGVLDVAVVRRVPGGGEQHPVQADPPGGVIDLVLVPASLRDLDGHVEVHGRRLPGSVLSRLGESLLHPPARCEGTRMPSRLRRSWTGLLAALVLAAGTGAPASPAAGEAELRSAQAEVRPRPSPAVPMPVVPVSDGTPVAGEALAAAVADELADTWLGERVAITVRDAATGEHLLDRDADLAVTPASLTKLLSAAAVVTTLSVDERFRTSVVAGSEQGELVLVAGGDMLLDPGEGDPGAVVGRAGLADLARQVAAALEADPGATAPPDDAAATSAPAGPAPVRLTLDTSYAAG